MSILDKIMSKRILCVGLVCVDFKTVVKEYPLEDTNQRTMDTIMERGGNASNSATVLSMLGCDVEYFGTVSDCQNKNFIITDFEEYGVNISNIVICDDSKCPVSIVIVNSENGSRTILHSNRCLRELTYKDFKMVNLSHYSWIHFEGRPNNDDIRLMVQDVNQYNLTVDNDQKITISLEFEKIRTHPLEDIIPLVDYAFFSKDYAKHYGFSDMETFVSRKSAEKNKTVICAWGECGAAAKIPSSSTVTSKSFPPKQMVDTTGAGDTFIAAVLYSLTHGLSLEEALDSGCCLAGAKCGMMGLRGLKDSRGITYTSKKVNDIVKQR